MTTATSAVDELLGAAAQPTATTPTAVATAQEAPAQPPAPPTPTAAWEQVGVFRLNCGSSKPQLFYGPIDVGAELAANGIEPTPDLLTALAHRKGRAPVVQVIRAAERGQQPTKRLAAATLAAMLREIGSSMQIQAAAM
jgi:hypothetical protein